ncbi:MAG: hypothetical protein KBB77_00620 [Candidatus Moranbacteria bacterium]|nr:hypothetical protein [Candidatus Moranbacteria bacterium]
MGNKQKGVLIVGLGVILLGGLVFIVTSRFNDKTTPTQPMTMIESKQGASLGDQPMVNDRTLSQYSFCGQAYKATPVLIDTVDVVQRISEIAAEDKVQRMCENINQKRKEILSVEVKQFPDAINYKASEYFVTINDLPFTVDIVSNKIYIISRFDGAPTYVGMLTKK